MLPIDPAIIAHRLATLGEHGRAASEARWIQWSKENPTKPCTHCAGRGNYVERAGERRPFDHTTFDAEKGDRYEATCPVCRGGGSVFITLKEHAEILKAKVEKARRLYAGLRARVCTECGIPSAKFDALAAGRITGEKTPAKWLEAATAVARDFGVVP